MLLLECFKMVRGSHHSYIFFSGHVDMDIPPFNLYTLGSLLVYVGSLQLCQAQTGTDDTEGLMRGLG